MVQYILYTISALVEHHFYCTFHASSPQKTSLLKARSNFLHCLLLYCFQCHWVVHNGCVDSYALCCITLAVQRKLPHYNGKELEIVATLDTYILLLSLCQKKQQLQFSLHYAQSCFMQRVTEEVSTAQTCHSLPLQSIRQWGGVSLTPVQFYLHRKWSTLHF